MVESGPLESLTVASLRGSKGRIVVWFDGLSHRDAAEAYKEPGLRSLRSSGGGSQRMSFGIMRSPGGRSALLMRLIGEVVQIVDGATDLWRFARNERAFFIPMVDEFVIEVDQRGNARS